MFLCVKRAEKTWPLVLDSSKHDIGQLFFSDTKQDTSEKGYRDVLICLLHAGFRPSIVLLLPWPEVTHMLLSDLFRLVLNGLVGEEAQQGDEKRQFCITSISKGSEVEEQRPRQYGVVQYL